MAWCHRISPFDLAEEFDVPVMFHEVIHDCMMPPADFLSEILDHGGTLMSLYGRLQGGDYNLTMKPEQETLAILKRL